jgi:hypothetical protein
MNATLSIHGYSVIVYGARYWASRIVKKANTTKYVTRKTGPFTWDVFFGNVVFENVLAYSDQHAVHVTRRIIRLM